jgi:glycosyltransferase involved in cell wall biosynthesis
MKQNILVEGLVSIIMPSWNTGHFIAETIQSVIEQTYTKWELIIVDDCSTDGTDDVVASFDDKRIKYFKNNKNIGAALTRNKALREARGEWIAFLDSDDLWMPKKLEHQLLFMQQNKYILSYTEYEKIDEESKYLNIYVSGPERVTKRKIYNYDYIGQLTMMYSAKEFGVVQIEDIKKNNDYALRLQLFKKTDTCAYLLKENLAKYRVRKVSISHDKFIKKLKSHFDLFYLCDKKNVVIALWYTCWNMFYGVLKKKKYENRKNDRQ